MRLYKFSHHDGVKLLLYSIERFDCSEPSKKRNSKSFNKQESKCMFDYEKERKRKQYIKVLYSQFLDLRELVKCAG